MRSPARAQRRRRFVPGVAAVALAAVFLGACSGGGDADPAASSSATTGTGSDQANDGASSGATELSIAVASFDLAVGPDARILAGVFTPERGLILGGEVDMRFFYFGEEPTADSQEEIGSATGTFLSVPGKEPTDDLSAPTIVAPADGAGVYEATVSLDAPGFYGVAISADVADLGEVSGTATFQVAAEHQVVMPGEPAPTVENLTVDSPGPAAAIDSRAQGDTPVPDPELHEITVADAVAAGRATVVVVSTPTFCISQFCGPITETIAELQGEFGDRADFVHIEVWKDFEASELNDAAAEWIVTAEGDGMEPWVFLVGDDGNVSARWDNVLDESELRGMLDELPTA